MEFNLSALYSLLFLTAENAKYLSELCVNLCELCGLVFLTAETAKWYAKFRKVNIQKGLTELKELM